MFRTPRCSCNKLGSDDPPGGPRVPLASALLIPFQVSSVPGTSPDCLLGQFSVRLVSGFLIHSRQRLCDVGGFFVLERRWLCRGGQQNALGAIIGRRLQIRSPAIKTE